MKSLGTKIRELVLILLCILGLADALFLFAQEQKGTVGHFCEVIAGAFGANCERVLTSRYAVVAGLDLTVWGILYYASLLWVSVWARFEDVPGSGRAARFFLPAISGSGFLVSMYLTYLQASVIKAWCPFCLVSAVLTALILVLSLMGLRRAAVSESPPQSLSPNSPAVGTLVFLCVLLSAGLAITLLFRTPERQASVIEQMMRYVPRRITPPGGLMYGSDSAPVTVLAFLDYTCQHCRNFEIDVFPRIKAGFVDSGRVKWINKILPHANSGAPMLFGMGGVCGRTVTDSEAVEMALFTYPIPSEKTGVDALAHAFQLAGLKPSVSSSVIWCVQTRAAEAEKQVVAEAQQAFSYGLKGPPAFVIDGIAFQGSMDYRTMSDLLEVFLKMRAGPI